MIVSPAVFYYVKLILAFAVAKMKVLNGQNNVCYWICDKINVWNVGKY